MKVYDFTRLEKREKKVYSVSDIVISTRGLSTKLLLIALGCVAISLLINIPIAINIGDWYFIPLINNHDLTGAIIVFGIPIGIACALFYLKISNYRLIDFLLLYLRPRNEIDLSGKKFKLNSVDLKTFLER